MNAISTKCTQCAAEIHLDKTQEFGFCTYCGTKVTREDFAAAETDRADKTLITEDKEESLAAVENTEAVTDSYETETFQPINRSAVAAFFIIVFVVIAVTLVFTEIIPNSRYKNAVALKESGSYDEAIAIFTDLGDYKASENQLKDTETQKEAIRINTLLNNAQKLYDSGDKMGAYKMLKPEKGNEKVAALLDEYKQAILDEASVIIEWDDKRNNSYRYGTLKNGDSSTSLFYDPWVNFCLIVNKSDSSDKRIYIEVTVVQSLAGNNLPSHPTAIVFENNGTKITLPMKYTDTNVEVDYTINGWWEIGGACATLDQVNAIANMFSNNQTVNMSLVGVTRQRNYILDNDEAKALTEMAEYLNIVYSLD